MLFRIAKENQERAGKAFTVEREKNNFGYKKSGILKPKSNRIMHYYEVDMIDADRIICTVRHKNNDCIVALVWLSGYTPESIEVEQAELYRNCSNYPYRREYNEKYLKKYDQIACIVHGAIAAGLLFDTVEAPTEPETSEAGQDTTCADKEPQQGTETAQKTTDMATFCAAYRAAYTALYDHCGEPETDERVRYYSALFDQEAEAIADTVRRFCSYRGDFVSSDREAATFMIALEAVGTPTDGKTATDGETTTTPETEPQRATESAKTTADDTTPTAGDTEPQRAAQSHETTTSRKSITTPTEGTQEAPQTAGTSEGGSTTTPPHKEPPRATDAATTGDGEQTTTAAAPTTSGDRSTANKMTGSHAGPAKEMTAERSERRKRYLQRMFNELARKRRKARRDAKEMTTGRATPPRHACENAPRRTEGTAADKVHTSHSKSPPRATQQARHTTGRSSPDRRKVTFSA